MGTVESKTAELATGVPGEKDMEWRTRTSLQLRINTTELVDKIQATGTLRDTANWSRHINRAVALGLREAARNNLAGTPLPKTEAVTSAGLVGGALAFNAMVLGIVQNLPAWGLATSGIMMAGSILLPNVIHAFDLKAQERPVQEGCYSVIPICHYDRIAMVAGLSRLGRFVRVID